MSLQKLIADVKALTIEQWAGRYNVGRTRAFEEIKSGRLKTYTVGRRRYISVAAADAWQRDREAEATTMGAGE